MYLNKNSEKSAVEWTFLNGNEEKLLYYVKVYSIMP